MTTDPAKLALFAAAGVMSLGLFLPLFSRRGTERRIAAFYFGDTGLLIYETNSRYTVQLKVLGRGVAAFTSPIDVGVVKGTKAYTTRWLWDFDFEGVLEDAFRGLAKEMRGAPSEAELREAREKEREAAGWLRALIGGAPMAAAASGILGGGLR